MKHDDRMLAQLTEAEDKNVSLDLIELKDFLNSEPGEKAQQKSREEIAELVSSLLEARAGKRVMRSLQQIRDKVNELNVRVAWEVEEEPSRGKEGEFEAGVRHRLWLTGLGPGRGILNIGGRKYTFRECWEDAESDPRKNHLLTIATALQDATFTKLKRCKQCRKFFLAERLSDRFCSPACSKAHFGGTAARKRVYATRTGQRNLDKLLYMVSEGLIPRQYRKAVELLGEGNAKEGLKRALELKKRKARGVPVKDIWKEIPKTVKVCLRGM